MNTIKINHHEDIHEEPEIKITETPEERNELDTVRKFARLLDSQFKIPGTDISFGLDPIIGMFPIVGDIVGYAFSALLIHSAFKKGVKGEILMKMLGNIGLDAVIGAIPVVGTLFDFAYKANNRNYKLLNEFVEEEKHTGSAWPYILGFLAITFIVFSSILYAFFSFLGWFWGLVG